jgi:hypothetical protein
MTPLAAALRGRPRRFWALVALLAVFLVALVVATYPGVYLWDTLEQARQGMLGDYTNAFPPFFSALLGVVVWLAGDPKPIFFVQLFVFFGPFFAFIANKPTTSRAALVVVVALLPNVWTLGITVAKDSFVIGLVLWALVFIEARKPWPAIAALTLSVLFRHNAVALSVPLLLLPVCQLVQRWPARIAACVVAAGFCAVAPKLVEKALDAQDLWPLGHTLVFDAYGIYRTHPEEYARGTLAAHNPLDRVLAHWNPCSIWKVQNATDLRDIGFLELYKIRDEVKAEHARLLRLHPGTYAKFRLEYFSCALGLFRDDPFEPYRNATRARTVNQWNIENRVDTLPWRAMNAVRSGAAFGTPLFMFKWYFFPLLLAVLVRLARVRRLDDPLAVLGGAGLLYAASFLVAGPVADHRYFIPVEIVALFYGVFRLEEHLSARAARKQARAESA